MTSTNTIEQVEEHKPDGKGDRHLLCEAPEGPFRQKVPVTFSADAAPTDPRLRHLERRLVEAFDELWNSFVDPAEPIYDVDGTSWNAIGSGLSAGGTASMPFRNEQELAAVRNECRALAVGNEFAINGHDYPLS
jgi:hypothetical protein